MKRSTWMFIAGGFLVAAGLAFFVSPLASGDPDGLNRVAIDEGFADTEQPHALDDGPLSGYAVEGVEDERLSTGLAGVVGVVVTFGVALLLFGVLRRRNETATGSPPPADV